MLRSKWIIALCAVCAVSALTWQFNALAGDTDQPTQCSKSTNASATKACCPAQAEGTKAACEAKPACEAKADCEGKTACEAKADCEGKTACEAKADCSAKTDTAQTESTPTPTSALAGLNTCANSSHEVVRLTNGVAVVYTVANGCPESTKTLQTTLASTCHKSVASELAKNCTKTQELLASGAVTIDKVLFRTGGMIVITGNNPTTVAALQDVIAPQPIQTAMVQ